jgi:predicted ATPase
MPRLLVLEDLHWLDPSSEELLRHLATEARGLPLLLLTTSRFPITGGSLELAKIRELMVPALPIGDIHALVDAQVEPYQAGSRLRQVVVERAEGNPLFVEELVRAFREKGELALEHSVHDIKPGADRTIPPTISALLASRIDRLPESARELVADAATLGREFPMAHLRAMNATERFDDDLGLVQRRGFVDSRTDGPVATLAFRHVLTQEVAYGGMLQPHRQARHRRAAEMLERLYRGRTQEVCDRLGHHWAHSDQPVRALPYLLAAADGAAAVGANRVAITHLETALGLTKEHPDAASKEQQDAARLKLAGLYFVVGER